jgi:hypothetical protein
MMAEILVCAICHFEVEADDVAVEGRRVICLGCYQRETHTEKPMSKGLRRDIEEALGSEK